MKIHFDVTEEDIKDGNPGDFNSCPIALSIARGIDWGNPVARVYVDDSTIEFEISGKRVTNGGRCILPEKIKNFVNDFDDGKPVKPFGFTVTIKSIPGQPTPNENIRADRTS